MTTIPDRTFGEPPPPDGPLPIVFDTSVLCGIRPEEPSPEFRLLQRLAASKQISLLVPEMAAREWLSQRCEPAIKAIDQFASACEGLQRHKSVSEQHGVKALIASELHKADALDSLRTESNRWHQRQLVGLGLKMIELQPEDMATVLDGYFLGTPPFSGKRSRKDLPDGIIFTGTRRIAAKDHRMIFVCDDARLGRAIELLDISVVSSLPDLLKLRAISSLHSDAAFALWWEEYLPKLVTYLQKRQGTLIPRIEDELPAAVCNQLIHHHEIPDDNDEAYVPSAGDFESIELDWNAAESLGEGVLSVPIVFDALIDFEFSIYRGDAFELPDWVYMHHEDFEGGHYIPASGARHAKYSARLVLEMAPSVMGGNIEIDAAQVSVHDAEFEDFLY